MSDGDPLDSQSTPALHCPQCGKPLEHVHRKGVDRVVNMFRSVQRYRCPDLGCGWEGVLSVAEAAPAPQGSLWRTRTLWFLMGATVAVAAAQGLRMAKQWRDRVHPAEMAVGQAEVRSRAAAPGQDFEGEILPVSDERVTENQTPLTLRNSCAWGSPGVNRYRGTVEQALVAAKLPREVIQQVAERAENGWSTQQVEISREGIRSTDHRRNYGDRMLAMAFGNTLCFNTRVNFPEGHVEQASLYEARDNTGRRYTVIVPYVCRNVAVLGERAELGTPPAPPPPIGTPEPAEWALFGLAGGLLAWFTRRRRSRR